MQDPRHIRIKDYDYHLPEARIAKFPLPRRDASKLLLWQHGELSHDIFSSLPHYLAPGELMLFNNTRVIQARLRFRKPTGAPIEVFCLEPDNPRDYEQMFATTSPCSWFCLVGNLKRWKQGTLELQVPHHNKALTLKATCTERLPHCERIQFEWDDPNATWADVLDAAGELPIPPYLNRKTQESDKTTYQTVYSKIKGSVAAPTAGLHFTPNTLNALDQRGIIRDEITLHVGAGTFKPVKSKEIADHEMHTEHFTVQRSTLTRLLEHNGQCIAVGTTTVRTLESLYYIGLHLMHHTTDDELRVSQWEPYDTHDDIPTEDALKSILNHLDKTGENHLQASTQIIIVPGYRFRIVKAMLTNFHQPQSTLLLLVSAFVGGRWREIYDYALAHDFRFLSYGDSSLLIP